MTTCRTSPEGEKDHPVLKMSIDSHLENVCLVGLAVNGICAHLGLDEVEAYQVEVCVVEAVNNVIIHAYNREPGHSVEVMISLAPGQIEFLISDFGRTMEKMETKQMDFDPEDYEALPEGGMGLYLIDKVMDEVSYQCRDGVNFFRMMKRVPLAE
jgi:serine/threonine-protein kinase RsbW